jgi:prevent-host-death family protein
MAERRPGRPCWSSDRTSPVRPTPSSRRPGSKSHVFRQLASCPFLPAIEGSPIQDDTRLMKSVGAFEAKTHLSRLLDEVERGDEIVITKHGRPVARLVPPGSPDRPRDGDLVAWLKAFRRGRRLGVYRSRT